MNPRLSMAASVAVTFSLAAASTLADESPPDVPEAIEEFAAAALDSSCVGRSLLWLKSVQNPDGSWGGGEDAFDAVTALALLAFMGHGETTASYEFGEAIKRGFTFLLADMKQPGRLERKGAAFGHGVAAWALCEGYGMMRVPLLKQSAEDALAVIQEGQRASGLWDAGYRTQDGQDDIEVSTWQVLAAASGLGMGAETEGLQDCLTRAANGMEKLLGADTDFTTTVAAACCLQLAGRGRTPVCKAAVGKLAAYTPNWDAPGCPAPVFRWYLVVQVLFKNGGQVWLGWNRIATPELVVRQTVVQGQDGKRLGYWDSPGRGEGNGRVCSTALCTLMLEVYYRYLPLYRQFPPPDEEPPSPDEDITIEIGK